jgi:hypothetical protein
LSFVVIVLGFANHFRRLLVIAHGNEGGMTQMPGICPLYESDLAYQLRFDPAALLHFLCGNDSPHREALFSGRFLNGHWAVCSAVRAAFATKSGSLLS